VPVRLPGGWSRSSHFLSEVYIYIPGPHAPFFGASVPGYNGLKSFQTIYLYLLLVDGPHYPGARARSFRSVNDMTAGFCCINASTLRPSGVPRLLPFLRCAGCCRFYAVPSDPLKAVRPAPKSSPNKGPETPMLSP
jgi:hypothetical protein